MPWMCEASAKSMPAVTAACPSRLNQPAQQNALTPPVGTVRIGIGPCHTTAVLVLLYHCEPDRHSLLSASLRGPQPLAQRGRAKVVAPVIQAARGDHLLVASSADLQGSPDNKHSLCTCHAECMHLAAVLKVQTYLLPSYRCRLRVLTRSTDLHCWAGTKQSQPWRCPAVIDSPYYSSAVSTGHCRNLGRPSRQVTVQKQNVERTTDMVIMATQNHPQIAETGPPLL